MNLKHLEIQLEQLACFSRPKLGLEQYGTPATVAARLLFHATMRGDIRGKRVCDLGCGTGILACGAALLGAGEVVGVDIDPDALLTGKENAGHLQVNVTFLRGDISDPALCHRIGPCDTVVMNPPFGAQKRKADRPFIDRALECGKIIYGIFNAGSSDFIHVYTKDRAVLDEIVSCSFPLRRTFKHHKKERAEIPVEIIRLVRI